MLSDSPSLSSAPPKSSICNVCGGVLTEKFSCVTDPRSRQKFSILACRECGLGHTHPVPPDLAAYYEASYHGGRHGFTANYCARRRLRMLRQIAGEGRGRSLLDVGCGDGTFLLQARDAGWKVCGTEMNPRLARESGLDVETDLVAVEARAPFDCITLWHSLEHMLDARATIAASRKLLSAGSGLLLLAVPDFDGLQARGFGRRWFHLDVPRHLFHFTYRSLQKLLDASGFELLRSWHQEFEYDLLGWSQSTLNCLLSSPNLFFDQLTHRETAASAGERCLAWLGGIAFSSTALPLLPLGMLLHRGGTLVMAARVRDGSASVDATK